MFDQSPDVRLIKKAGGKLQNADFAALLAAAGPSEQSVEAWNELMETVTFDDLSENTQRLVPAIYRNVRSQAHVRERDRMRGAFKHHWSRNTRLLFECGSVLRALNESGKPYRVLKGAAVQTMAKSVGSRVMGDLDLLVHSEDARLLEAILYAQGFRRSSYADCPFHTEANLSGAMDFSRADVYIDVHVAELKEPKNLLLRMLESPGVLVSGPCGIMHLPEPELLLLHACVHGKMAVNNTDLIQALVDISTLQFIVDLPKLEKEARATHTVFALDSLDSQLRAWGLPGSGARFSPADFAKQKVAILIRSFPNLLDTGGSIGRRIGQRQRGLNTVRKILNSFSGRRRVYAIWVLFGQFAICERAVIRLWGGFLHQPVTLVSNKFKPLSDDSFPGTTSNVSAATLDWRFRISFEDGRKRRWLHFQSSAFDRIDAFVFVNGVPKSRIVAADPTSRTVGIFGAGSSAEVSLRPLWPACPVCFGGFDDLQISITT